MIDPEKIRLDRIAYEEIFGEQIEDIRSMTPEMVERLPEMVAMALDRGYPLTREERGLGDELPPEATI